MSCLLLYKHHRNERYYYSITMRIQATGQTTDVLFSPKMFDLAACILLNARHVLLPP